MKTIDRIVADMGRGVVWQGGQCRRSGECCEDCGTCRRVDDLDVVDKMRAQNALALIRESDIEVALDRLLV